MYLTNACCNITLLHPAVFFFWVYAVYENLKRTFCMPSFLVQMLQICYTRMTATSHDSSQVMFEIPTLSTSSDEVVLSACICFVKLQELIFCFQSLLMFAAVYVVVIKATIDAGGLDVVWEIAVNGSRIEFDK